MNLLKLSDIAKLPGSPSRQALTLLTKRIPLLPFLHKAEGIWNIDIDDPAWPEYLKEAQQHSLTKKMITQGGTALPRQKMKNKNPAAPLPLVISASEPQTFPQEAIDAVADKEIQEARLKKYKADLEEIKVKEKTRQYVPVETLQYYGSYIERLIGEGYATVKRVLPDLAPFYESANYKGAEQNVLTALQKAFEHILKSMQEDLTNDGN